MSCLVSCSTRTSVDRQTNNRQTNRLTHRPSTVTLAAHVRRGLIGTGKVWKILLLHLWHNWKLTLMRGGKACYQTSMKLLRQYAGLYTRPLSLGTRLTAWVVPRLRNDYNDPSLNLLIFAMGYKVTFYSHERSEGLGMRASIVSTCIES